MRNRRRTAALSTLVLSLAFEAQARADAADELASPSGDERDLDDAGASSEPAREAETSANAATADVEVSIGVHPQLLVGGASGGGAGLGRLAGGGSALGSFAPSIGVAFALSPTTFLTLGVSGAYAETSLANEISLSGTLGVLVYLDTPSVGAVVPHGRVFGTGAGFAMWGRGTELGGLSGALGGGLGITWLPMRNFGLRAEANVAASGAAPLEQPGFALGLALGAHVALVLRL